MLLELDSEEYCQALVTRIDDKVKELDQRYRGHLGFSGIGDSDERKLWLSFRWCLPPTFEGRMLRLFDLGNRIEDQVIEHLGNVIPVAAKDEDGEQFNTSLLGGHFAGSTDGLVKDVFPAPNEDTMLLLEVKSANDKRFKELANSEDYEGWSEAYRWQIHCYMGAFNLEYALVVVYNKNTSHLYTQIIPFNEKIWEKAQEKAQRIIESSVPFTAGKSESAWEMKYEAQIFKDIYFKRRLPPSANCRNCLSSKPLTSSNGAVWFCRRHEEARSIEDQRAGCEDHLWIPDLVNADHFPEQSTDDVIAYTKEGKTFTNAIKGEVGAMAFSSVEMRELSKIDFDANVMEHMEPLRTEFNGHYIEAMNEDEDAF